MDGCETPEFSHQGKLYVEALRGRNFTLRLSNPTGDRVAVALSVDGRNVVDAKRTTASDAAKWILAPGQTIEVPGWQVSGETSRRFFFTETARSYAKWLGDTRNVGTIEAVFYRERRREPVAALDEEAGNDTGASAGQLRNDSPPAAAGKSSPERKSGEIRPTGSRHRDRRPDAVPGAGASRRRGRPVRAIALRYEFRRELVRLGVLPRFGDGLAARERSRDSSRASPDPGGDRLTRPSGRRPAEVESTIAALPSGHSRWKLLCPTPPTKSSSPLEGRRVGGLR